MVLLRGHRLALGGQRLLGLAHLAVGWWGLAGFFSRSAQAEGIPTATTSIAPSHHRFAFIVDFGPMGDRRPHSYGISL